jgi:predicted nucleic acid-binding protein
VTIVVDASIALKWVIEEDDSPAARDLLSNETLIAPDLLLIECANVLWVKARRSQLTREAATLALAAIDSVPIRIAFARDHVSAAQTIAFELGQSAYDSLYLALAFAERATLVTADEAFAKAALAHPVYRGSLRHLNG